MSSIVPDHIESLLYCADRNNIPHLQYVEDNSDFQEGFWIGFPRDRETLETLEELDLSWHSLTKIPSQLRYLTPLKVLRISKRRDGLQPPFYEAADNNCYIEDIPRSVIPPKYPQKFWMSRVFLERK